MENNQLIFLPLSEIVDSNSKRSRKWVGDLFDSIGTIGLKTPLVVRKVDDRWHLESGSRRLKALKELRQEGIIPPGIDDWNIPCYVSQGNGDQDHDLVRLVTNVQEEMSPSDIGKVLVEMLENFSSPTTIGFLSSAIGKSEGKVQLLIDLAVADPELQHKVDSGEMSLSAFSRIRNAPKQIQQEIAGSDGKITVEKTNRILHKIKMEQKGLPFIVADEPTNIQELNGILNKIRLIVADKRNGPKEQYLLQQIANLISGDNNDS